MGMAGKFGESRSAIDRAFSADLLGRTKVKTAAMRHVATSRPAAASEFHPPPVKTALIGQFYPQNYPIIAGPCSATGSTPASGWEIFTTSNAFAHRAIADVPHRPAILRNGSAR